jgi:hypothetical protein
MRSKKLAGKSKVFQRKRRETKKNNFERENEGVTEEEEREKKNKFWREKEGVTEEEAIDKEEKILTGKQKVLK